ncbi:hypothetical protein SB6421_03813 [Klebsiella huaxiensis]|uniref:glycosyltransferase family 2 protein n=1 Tax=Klebsiella huaxiensis TaxID=2153354 RepID=UPI001158FF89|nr:glycosyltransferase family 2 protein [Klebsiella huaxiensis]VUS83862.1 hypothetical protein SB6421_03813 [Klebsiella huaxiensis]
MKSYKVASVIVTYHPELNNIKKLVASLSRQNVLTVIVDNGTLSECDYSDLALVSDVIALTENEGIAKAQNVGIEFCRKKYNVDYILFFDQDSEITDNYVYKLTNDFFQLSDSGLKLAAIGPTFIDSRYKFYYKQIRLSKYGVRKKVDPQDFLKAFEVSLLISSGSLVPVSVLDEVGKMNEDFFIDYVDTEWCLRAAALGYKLFISKDAVMEHAIGDKMITFMGLHVPVHSSIRRYYRIRNSFLFFKLPHVPLILKIRDSLMNVIHQLLLILTQKDKRANIKVFFKAVFDGLSNRFGKINQAKH